MEIRKELYYTRSHEWVEYLPNGDIRMGITDHAQQELGDIVYVNLPVEGDEFAREEAVASVESVKAVADVFAPLSGRVTEVNDALADAPELINEDPYGAWLITLTDVADDGELMSAMEYEVFAESEEG